MNQFIEHTYRAVKNEKPHVKFGLSPFGIWRPGHPPSIRGFDQYRVLYADARLWLHKGWVDYWSPQLYWPISQIPQSFPVLLGWWTRENNKARNLWPGLFTSRISDSAGTLENINQIMTIRGFVPDLPGHIHFSMKALMEDRQGIKTALKKGPYAQQALVPPSPWLDDQPPDPPTVWVTDKNDSLEVAWNHPDPDDVFRWVLYYQYAEGWQYLILDHNTHNYKLPSFYMILPNVRGANAETDQKKVRINLSHLAVSAVDRTGNESARTIQKLPLGFREE